jgi:putative transposase
VRASRIVEDVDVLEEIHDGFAARRIIKNWIAFYNADRLNSVLDQQKPDEAYSVRIKRLKAA